MKHKTTLIAALAISILGINQLGFSAHHESEDRAKLHQMYHIKIKTGHHKAFYEDLAKHSQWRRDEGDPWTWYVLRVVNGKDDGDCIIRSGGLHWKDIDEYGEFGAKGGDKFWEDVGKHIEDSNSWLSMDDTRYERWMPDDKRPMLVSVINYSLKPGKSGEFFEAVEAYHNTIIENDHPAYYQFGWMANGGNNDQVTLAMFFENWTDMTPPEEKLSELMKRVHGEEKALEVFEKFAGATRYSDSMILRMLPGLSIFHDE